MKWIVILIVFFLVLHLLSSPVQTSTGAGGGCTNPGQAAWAQMSTIERAVYGLCAASQPGK